MDIYRIKEHLIILGDVSGDCANCKEIGLDPWKAKECPHCKAQFEYIASRRSANHPGERFQIARRILEKRSDLTVIDYDDYQKTIGAQSARDFFK